MAKHMVICKECGKRFDASKGAYYLKDSRRYMCKKCGKEHNANLREQVTGVRQSTGAAIAKIAFGLLFLVSGVNTGSLGGFFTGLIIAGALILWGAMPYIKKALEKKKTETKENSNKKHCKACGAMSTGTSCEYCGSPLD